MKKTRVFGKLLSACLSLCILTGAGALSAAADGAVVFDNCDDAGLVRPGEAHFHGTVNDYDDKKEGEACYKTSQDGSMTMACMWRNVTATDTKQTMETGAVQFWLYLPEYESFARKEHSVIFEISSSGQVDVNELEWDVEPYLTQDGWNLITLPFSDSPRVSGNIDLTKVDTFRILATNIDDFEMKVDLIQFVNKADFVKPTEAPTEAPTQAPTEAPTQTPTQKPTTADTRNAGGTDKTDAGSDASATKAANAEEGGGNALVIVLVVVGVLVLAGGGVAVFFILRKKDDGTAAK